MPNNLAEAKTNFIAARNELTLAYHKRDEAASALYRSLLTEKELAEEQPCELTDKTGKKIKGVFRISSVGDTPCLRFFPYKKDATLSSAARAFCFGVEPDISWEATEMKSIMPCTPPVGIEHPEGS